MVSRNDFVPICPDLSQMFLLINVLSRKLIMQIDFIYENFILVKLDISPCFEDFIKNIPHLFSGNNTKKKKNRRGSA